MLTIITQLSKVFPLYTGAVPLQLEAWGFFFPDSVYGETDRALDDVRHEALIAYELYKLGRFRV